MVVDKFDTFCTSISPDEADAPLRIDPDTVLPATIADQPLQPITRRDPEVLDILRRMDQFEFPQRRSLHDPINTFDVLLMPNALGVLTPERSDHSSSV